MDEDTEKAIVMEFECPVCINHIYPPIRQCIGGHIFCDDCFKRVKRCPQCRFVVRSPKGLSRCYALERIHAKLTFPCKFEGCTFSAKGSLIKKHERGCGFIPITCPLMLNYECTWNGTLQDIGEHCKKSHPQNVFFGTWQKLMSSGFANEIIDRLYHIMFCVYGEVFRLTWDLNSKTENARFGLYQIGRAEKNDRFQYVINFYSDFSEDENTKTLSIEAASQPLVSIDERFLAKTYFTLTYSMLADVCNVNGDLNYEVKIIDKRENNENVTLLEERIDARDEKLNDTLLPFTNARILRRSRSLDILSTFD